MANTAVTALAASAIAPSEPSPDPHTVETSRPRKRSETRHVDRHFGPIFLLTVCLAGVNCSSPADAVDSPKETVPLEDTQQGRDEQFQSVQQEFNACLGDASYGFRGFAGGEGDASIVEDRSYQEALLRCANESDIAALRAEFSGSRAGRSPDQIREENEAILGVVSCLRAKGMELGDPLQDETGALNLRQILGQAGADIREDQEARKCMSELLLIRSQSD